MAHVERRRILRRDSSGRLRVVTRYRVRYRDESGKQHCETEVRLVDAERRKAEIKVALAGGTWRDPRRGDMRLHEWVEQCYPPDMICEGAATWASARNHLAEVGPASLRRCAASRDHQQ